MVDCDYCGKPTNGYAHKCKFCGQVHCSEHLLPESHDCMGLEYRKQKNSERWGRAVTGHSVNARYNVDEEDEEPVHEKPTKHVKQHHKKQNFSDKLKDYAVAKYESLKYWLRRREHHRYDFEGRSSYLITTILILAAAIVGVAIFYSNAEKLNEIDLWIIKLGGLLILVSLFFAIKYGWRFGKEIINIFKRQRNWFRYLVIILIVVLLWQGYTHKDDVLNPVFSIYNQTNFTLLMPVGIGNFSLDTESKGVSFDYSDSTGNKKSGNIKAESPLKPDIDIHSLEREIHDLINEERRDAGLSSLSWDSALADVARGHSEDMAQNDYFSHDNLRGQDPTDRANARGYNCYKDYGGYYTEGIAENIFQNNLYDSITYVNLVPFHDWSTQSEIAESTVDGWMNSPGHRQNILTSTYDKEGIGVAIASDDKVYITENFC